MDSENTHRLIYSLKLNVSPPPGSRPGVSCQLIVPLCRDGNSGNRNGRPRPPRRRTIDLRVGDDVLVDGIYRKVLGIEAYREHWLTEEQATSLQHEQGYLV